MIFSVHGTVWPNVLPLCIINVIITISVYFLKDYEIVDLTFADDGHKILATMVAFLVVSRVSAAYNRFWEARTLLSKALQQCRQLSIHAAAFTREDNSDKAINWRLMVRYTVQKLASFILVCSSCCVAYVCGLELCYVGQSKNYSITQSGYSSSRGTIIFCFCFILLCIILSKNNCVHSFTVVYFHVCRIQK